MFERFSRSWELVKASASVLRADKELMIFPLISALAILIVTATFAFPLIFTGSLATSSSPEFYLILFLFYLVQYFVIIYFNSALVGAALIRIKGGGPTAKDGFGIANGHLGTILGYAVISATVGLILRWLSERGSLGRLATSLFGLAWNLATFLAVPILVTEGVSPIDAIRRSTELLKRTWGEQIVGNFSIGLIFGLIFIGVFLLGIAGFMAVASTGSLFLTAAVAIIFVLILLGMGLVSSALSGIFAAAIYSYATTGSASTFFSADLIRGAFQKKTILR
jgi:hypothetical protein